VGGRHAVGTKDGAWRPHRGRYFQSCGLGFASGQSADRSGTGDGSASGQKTAAMQEPIAGGPLGIEQLVAGFSANLSGHERLPMMAGHVSAPGIDRRFSG